MALKSVILFSMFLFLAGAECIRESSGSIPGQTLWSWSHESSYRDIHAVLRDGFNYSKHYGIGADDSLTLAPSPSHDGTYVLRVFYKQGTFSSHNSNGTNCQSGVPCQRGAMFYAVPGAIWNQTYTTLTLEYEVWFGSTFEFNKGGKLPGLWGGTRTCSGGRASDTCFSTRMKWGRHGDGGVYAYITRAQKPDWNTFCHDNDRLPADQKYRQEHCLPGNFGTQIGLGSFRFKLNHWNRIRQEIHLNATPDQFGHIKVWVDDVPKIYVNNIVMRASIPFGIDGILFSTFYGGSTASWACPQDAYTYYRNFRISTDVTAVAVDQLVG